MQRGLPYTAMSAWNSIGENNKLEACDFSSRHERGEASSPLLVTYLGTSALAIDG